MSQHLSLFLTRAVKFSYALTCSWKFYTANFQQQTPSVREFDCPAYDARFPPFCSLGSSHHEIWNASEINLLTFQKKEFSAQFCSEWPLPLPTSKVRREDEVEPPSFYCEEVHFTMSVSGASRKTQLAVSP